MAQLGKEVMPGMSGQSLSSSLYPHRPSEGRFAVRGKSAIP
jgi:hypothetical protein